MEQFSKVTRLPPPGGGIEFRLKRKKEEEEEGVEELEEEEEIKSVLSDSQVLSFCTVKTVS